MQENNVDLTIGDKSPTKNDNIFSPKKSSTFWVVVKDRVAETPFYEKNTAGDYLYRISLSRGHEQMLKCYFELNDNYLFCYRESNKLLVAYLDLEFAKIKYITQTTQGVKYHGIRIIKHKNYEDILSEDEELIKKWMDLVKKHCILSQFSMSYESVKVLGQGNFAKVFLVKHKTTGKLLATKVFDKKAITSDEMEKVEQSHPEMLDLRSQYS